MQLGNLMGQTNSTPHNKPLNLIGYFQVASLHLDVAFFIGSKSLIEPAPLPYFLDESKLDCPTNVPNPQFSQEIILYYLDKSKLSQGICNHLLSIFVRYSTILHIFYKEDIQ